MLPTKSFISTNNNNNNITDIITNTNNNSSSSVSFQAKRKPKMETNNINKPISSTQTTTLSSKQPTVSMNQQHHHSHHHHHHQQQQNESKLYVLSSIELRENLENTLEESYNKLKHLISPNATNNNSNQQPDNNLFNELSNYSNQSKAQYDEVCNALLYSILTDQSNSSRCLRNLFLCNNLTISFSSSSSVSSSINQSINMSGGLNDPNSNSSSYGVLINNLNSIITENYQRLLDIPRQQLIWLLRELVKARVNQCERLLLQMLRHIQSGSLTEKNYWLAESMLDILTELQTNSTNDSNNSNTSSSSSSQFWIYSHNELMTQTLYTYLRIIADHGQAVALTQLRQRETEFCIQILRERWTECMQIGRDLVRLLQNLAKINEFDQLWRDITQSPQVLSPQFAQLGGLSYMMRLPSRRRCLISRLTIEMERKIYFIITSVKAGQQKRYLEWFQRQYLNTPESQSLRVDIIRYICVVVHPTNEQLNSGLTPRWSLCAWLLNTCTNQIELANLKLALFFDWLFYDAKKDNIMLIEPAILLMFNSIRCQNTANPVNNLSSSLTNSLFDFLCRISTNYYWPLRDQILNGIMQSFKDSVEKRVIPSMQVFFANITDTTTNQNSTNNNNNNNNKFNTNNQQSSILLPDLKVLIQNTFGNFFQTLNLNQTPQSPAIVQQPPPASVTPPPLISSQAVSPILKQSNESPSFGSGLSLFKQRPKTELVSDESGISSTEAPSTPSTTPPSSSLSSTVSQPLSFQSYFSFNKTENNETIKTEPTPILLNSNEFTLLAKTEPQAQFSSDEEESQPNQFINRQTFNNNNDNSQTNTLKQASYSGVQKQLHSFTISNRPYKVFTTIDDCNSILNTNSNSLENHLNLIQSDDLRDKLTELNEKLKELNPINTNQDNYQFTSQPHMSLNSFNYLSSLFKDILNFIHKDQEFLNNFNTSLADLAVSICLILQNDFNNQLLPAQCYATNYNSNNNNNNNRLKQQNSTSFTDQSNQSLFSPNLNFLNSIIDQSLNQRLIFSLFKELSFTTNQSPSREILVQLLHEIYLKQNRVGYYFLFYIYLISLKSSNSVAQSSLNGSCSNSKSKVETRTLIEIYLEFTKDRRNEIKNEFKLKQKKKYSDDDDDDAESSNEPTDSDTASESEQDDNNNEENESINESSSNGGDDDDDEILVDDLLDEDDIILGECYMQDIRLCQQDDPYLFCFMIPFILRELHESKKSNYMINNSELCQLISSCIDSKQLKDLISSITSQELVLLKEPKSNQNKSKNKKTTRNSNNTTESTNKKRKRTSDSNNKRNNNKSNCKILDKKSNKKKGKNKKTSKNNKLITTSHSLADVLEASLVWESIEQIFFWQILIAHDDIEINSLLPLFCKLDSNTHSEANYHLFQLLKTSEPTFDIVKFLINRRIDENMEKALFVHWTRRLNASDIKISQIFCKLLNKSATTNNQNQQTSTLKKIKYNESFTNNKKLTAEQQLEIANQQKANSRSKLQLGRLQSIDMDQIPSLDQVLFCLNKLRLNNECMKFILKENILETLQKVHKKYCDDETKKKYSDLFTLAIDESNENGNNRNDNNNNNNEDDENENDDENNESENSSNEDNENSSDSQNESDSNEQQTSKIKKIKSSPRTTKNSMNKSFNNNKSTTASAKSGNKRTIKTLNSKSKKQKLKNSNSSDSEDNNRPRRNNKDASDSDEGKNSDSESDSSTERKKVNKNSRKKT